MGNGGVTSVRALSEALGAAVVARREGWALADFAAGRLGRAAAVAVPGANGWRIDGAAQLTLDGRFDLPLGLPPEVYLARFGGVWVGPHLRHGGRVVARLLACGSDSPSETLSEMA